MLRSWGMVGGMGILLLALVGCRKSLPDLKPPERPETLTVPPMEGRFSTSSMPKEAFRDRESTLMRRPDAEVMPAGAPGMPGGGPGMGRGAGGGRPGF